eukprot:4465141-Alexandrium_andersonii.AAC.1
MEGSRWVCSERNRAMGSNAVQWQSQWEDEGGRIKMHKKMRAEAKKERREKKRDKRKQTEERRVEELQNKKRMMEAKEKQQALAKKKKEVEKKWGKFRAVMTRTEREIGLLPQRPLCREQQAMRM